MTVTYTIERLLAHIEKGWGRDGFGQTHMEVLCGAYISSPGGRSFVQNEMADPMFYQVCGSCQRIQKGREAKANATPE